MLITIYCPAPAQVVCIWNGTTGSWTNAGIWSPTVPQNGQPNPGDIYDAIINSGGTITLDTNIIIQTLSFQNGTIAGSNSLTMNALMTWGGGTFGGTAGIFANGGANITGATTNQRLDGGALTLGGSTSSWSGGSIFIDNGSVLTNSVGSTFTATGDNSIARFTGTGMASFVNAGTFVKNTGTGTTSISVAFTNSGTVAVQSGTLAISGGGSSSGAFTVGNGTTLRFNGGTFDLTAGSSVSGAGTTNFTAGTVNVAVPFTTATTISGGTVNFTGGPYSIPSLDFSNGVLGGNANVTVTGPLTWSGGTFATSGTVMANVGASITGATTNQRLDGSALTLGGSAITWSGGSIFIDNGSVLTNSVGSTLAATGNNIISRFTSVGTASFVNAGTFRKETGTGTTSIGTSITFTNTGTVDVQSGTISIGSTPLQNNGLVTTALNTTINGPITSNSGGIVHGVGTYGGPLQFNSGSTLHPGLSPGVLNVTGAVTMTPGSTFSLELNGTTPGTQHGQLLLSGASASIDLGGATLATSLGYAPSISDSLTVIAGAPITGTFANAPPGQPFFVGTFGGTSYNAFATYQTNIVLIGGFTPVPEPVHSLLAASAVAAFGWWRHRRKTVST